MNSETLSKTRRYKRISFPNGMFVVWYDGRETHVSRLKTLGMGGLFLSVPFLSVSSAPPVGTNLTLVFEALGGGFQAEGIVRDVVPGEGIGVEFTRMATRDRILLEALLGRLLH